MTKISAGIIGLGQIGMGYDTDVQSDTYFLSHSKSFFKHPDFELKFLMDIDKDLLEEAKLRFPGVNVVDTINNIDVLPELVVLAANSKVNANYLESIIENEDVKLILVEKPVSNLFFEKYTEVELEEISDKIYVNYTRKYVPYFKQLRADIANGIFGNCSLVNIYYSKGIRNNGSHFIDLAKFLFSNYEFSCQSVFRKINDYSDLDPSISCVLKADNGNHHFEIVFNSIDERNYSVLEMDIFFEKGRRRIYDFGVHADEYGVKPDPLFPNYVNLIPDKIKLKTELNKYGYFLGDKVWGILRNGETNDSNLLNEKSIFELIKKINNKQ